MGLDLILTVPLPGLETLNKDFFSLGLSFLICKMGSRSILGMRIKWGDSCRTPPTLFSFLSLTEAKLYGCSLPLLGSCYLGGAWASGVLTRQPWPLPYP